MWCAKLSFVSAPFRSTMRKEQGIFVLPDTWTTDLQNVACSGCSSRLECEVFQGEQGVPAHTHQNSCVRYSTRRISEPNSWWCLENDQNCMVWKRHPLNPVCTERLWANWCSSLLIAQIFNSVSRNVPEECKVPQLETCRGQSASVDISWVLAIGH